MIDSRSVMRHASRLHASLLFLLFMCLPACGPASDPGAETNVIAVLESFYGAMKNGDTAAAMNVIAPDAMFVESGRLETRDEYEKNHLPADIGFEKQVTGKRGQWRVTVNGDTAWAIAETEFVGTFDGNPVDFVSSQLAVLSRGESDNWQIRSIHWSSRRR
jgi:ketosteroid isomerase-like protein